MDYQKITLSDLSLIGDPGSLPADLQGLDDVALSDLNWTDPDLGYVGHGYWPVVAEAPPHDWRRQEPGGYLDLWADIDTKTVQGSRAVVDRAEPEPWRVAKIDFWRLFTRGEKAFYQGLRKQIAELTSVQFADIAYIGYVYASVVIESFEILTEYIELDHPETIEGLQVLQQCGMLTEARLQQVLAAEPPPAG